MFGTRRKYRLGGGLLILAAVAGFCRTAPAGPPAEFDPGRCDTVVGVNQERSDYTVQSYCLLPGEELTVEILRARPGRRYGFRAGAGRVRGLGPGKWRWLPPAAPGLYQANLRPRRGGPEVRLNCFVLVPASDLRDPSGRRVGRYPRRAGVHSAVYAPPRGFIRATAQNLETWVSPHFQLKQFLCKQPGAFPKYLVLDHALLRKLEKLLAEVNRRGYACRTFTILSGFRTPAYNRRLGNSTFSAHQWGRAADLFIDEDGDGRQDDLNRDGAVDFRDLEVVYEISEALDRDPQETRLVGGLSLYRKNAQHGPFLHVDVRGFPARWGLLVRREAHEGPPEQQAARP